MKRQWLIDLRKEKGLTQEEVAQKSEITPAYYCLIENGKRTGQVDKIKKIADVLGFYWARLLDE